MNELELDSFSDRARDDRCRGGREHRLEEEVGPVGVATVRVGRRIRSGVEAGAEAEARESEIAAEVAGVHQIEAAHEVGEDAGADDEGVLEEDVGRVLGAGQAGLDHREAEVHDEHERCGEHHPDVVRREERG